MKDIHQLKRLPTAKCAPGEVMANAPTDEFRSSLPKLKPQMRFWLSLSNSDSVSTIPRYTAATGNNFTINPNQPIWHLKKSEWISCWQSYDVQMGDDCTEIKPKYNWKQSPYRKRWEEALWSALTGWKSQLEISHWAYLGGDPCQSEQASGEQSASAPGDETTSQFRQQ